MDVVIDAADTIGFPFQRTELLIAAATGILPMTALLLAGTVKSRSGPWAAFVAHLGMTTTLDAGIVAGDDRAVRGLRLTLMMQNLVHPL